MKNINHRNIRLIFESLRQYDTAITHPLPMPQYIYHHGQLFKKAKTIFEDGQSTVSYVEMPLVALSSIEAVSAIEVHHV